MICYRNSK